MDPLRSEIKLYYYYYYLSVFKTIFSQSLLFLYCTVPLCINHTEHATMIRLNYTAEPEPRKQRTRPYRRVRL